MNNAVPLILNPFHPKGKMLCWGFELNSAPGAAETWGFKRPYLKICKNTVMEYFNVQFLDLTWGKEEQLPVGWHIWSTQHQIKLHFNYHPCPTFMTFYEFIALVLNCVKVLDLCNTNESSIYINCAIHTSLYTAYLPNHRQNNFKYHFSHTATFTEKQNISTLNHIMCMAMLI